MEQLGWVTSAKVEQSTRPNKRVYGITKAGNDELITWLKNPSVEQLMVVRSPLVIKLFFSAKVDRHDVINLLVNYRTECEKTLTQLQDEISSLTPVDNLDNKPQYWMYTTDYCIGYYKFLIDWSTNTIESLTQLTQN